MKNIKKIGYIFVLCAFLSSTNVCFPDSPNDLVDTAEDGLVFGDQDNRSRFKAVSDFLKARYSSAREGFKDAENDEKAGLVLTAISVLGVLFASIGQFIGASKEETALLEKRFFILKEHSFTGKDKDLPVQFFENGEKLPGTGKLDDIIFVKGDKGFENGELRMFVNDKPVAADFKDPVEGHWVSLPAMLPPPPMNIPPSGSSKPFDSAFGDPDVPTVVVDSALEGPGSRSIGLKINGQQVEVPVTDTVPLITGFEKDGAFVFFSDDQTKNGGHLFRFNGSTRSWVHVNPDLRENFSYVLSGIPSSISSSPSSFVAPERPLSEVTETRVDAPAASSVAIPPEDGGKKPVFHDPFNFARPQNPVVPQPSSSPAVSSSSSSSAPVLSSPASVVEVVPAVDALPLDQIPFGQWSLEDAKGRRFAKVNSESFFKEAQALNPKEGDVIIFKAGDIAFGINQKPSFTPIKFDWKWVKIVCDGTESIGKVHKLSSLDEIFT